VGSALPCFAELPAWTDNLFAYLNLQYYIVPDFVGTLSPSLAENYGASSDLLKPYPGFRAGAGYQWNSFRFFLESGYTYIKGENPLVLDIYLAPLIVKAGYDFYPLDVVSVTPVIGIGFVFARVNYYETAIDILLDKSAQASSTGLMAYAGVQGAWHFAKAFSLNVAAGFEGVIETGGLIPLPSLELGLTVNPFRLFKKTAQNPMPVILRGYTVPK
jgi:hypothetical protein